MSKKAEQKRVLFADYSTAKFQATIDFLHTEKIAGDAVSDIKKFYDKLKTEEYSACLVNLVLGGVGPVELFKNIRSISKNPEIRILVISKQVAKENIENCIRAGASDFVVDPFDSVTLGHRILYHLTPKQTVDESAVESEPLDEVDTPMLSILVDGIEMLSKTTRNQEHAAFYKILKRVAEYMNSNRTSLIIVDPTSGGGMVLASSDDPGFHDFPISLQNYPEILHAVNTGNFIVYDDVSSNVMTARIKDRVKSIEIGSILVFPIRFQNEICGVVTIRRPKATKIPPLENLRVLNALVNTMAAHTNMRYLLRKIYRGYAAAQ